MASTSALTSSSSSRTSSVLDDPSNPLYLHHEESPGAMLVYQTLVGENYPTWERLMRMALIAKNKLEFIDGTLTLSSPMVKTSSAIQAWIRCNKMVTSWILNSVSHEIATSIVKKDTAFEIWKDLRERLSQEYGPRVFQLQKDIAGITQGQSSITSSLTQMNVLWDQLQKFRSFPICSCGFCTCNLGQKLNDLQHQLAAHSTSMAEFAANNSELGSPTISEERIPSLVEYSFTPSAKLESVSSVLNRTNPIPARSLSISLLFPPAMSEFETDESCSDSNETRFSYSIPSYFPPARSETDSSSENFGIIPTYPSISASPRHTTTFKEIIKPKSSNSSKSNGTPPKFSHSENKSTLSLFSAAKSLTNSSKRPRRTILTRRFQGLMEIIDMEIFPLKMLLEATNNFSEGCKIETNDFGSLYHAILDDGREVAIKRAEISMSKLSDDDFLSKCLALSLLNHKNVVRLLGFCEDSKERLSVYEHMENGTLYGHLHNPKSTYLMSWAARIKVALDIARGIEYLHVYAVPPIIHRDIKPSNIFLDATLTAKLSNFDISVKSDIEYELIAGTLGYLDPRYLTSGSLTTEVDVYSFGVVLLEMLSGLSAFHTNQNGKQRLIVDFVVPYTAQKEIHGFLDPKVPPPTPLEMEALPYVASLALDCVSEERVLRPSMTKVANSLQIALEGILEGQGDCWGQKDGM